MSVRSERVVTVSEWVSEVSHLVVEDVVHSSRGLGAVGLWKAPLWDHSILFCCDRNRSATCNYTPNYLYVLGYALALELKESNWGKKNVHQVREKGGIEQETVEN